MVDLEADSNFTLLDEYDLAKVIKLLNDFSISIFHVWFQHQQQANHKVSVNFILPGIETPNYIDS